MKQAVIVLLILLVSARLCEAQATTDCSKFNYNYLWVSGGEPPGTPCTIGNTITDDPLHAVEPSPFARWQPGEIIEFCTPHDLTQTKPGCVDGNALKACIEQAWHDWANICPPGTVSVREDDPNNPPNGCCIDIAYETDPRKFHTVDNDPNSTDHIESIFAQAQLYFNCPDPFLKCLEPVVGTERHMKILINETGKQAGNPVFPCTDANQRCNGLHPVNLCNALRHEIGHMFGLAHLEQYDYSTKPPGDPSGYALNTDGTRQSDGLVTDLLAAEAFFDWKNSCDMKPMSINDRCAFQKLYCPGAFLGVSSSGAIAERSFTLKPNPATSKVKVMLNLQSSDLGMIHVFSITGELIRGLDQCVRGGQEDFSLDVSSLASGAYVVSMDGTFPRVSRLLRIKK